MKFLSKKILIILIFALIATLAGNLVFNYWRNTNLPQNTLPTEYTTINGKTFNKASIDNKVVLLVFWATNCAICIKELPEFKSLYNQLKPLGFELFAIAMGYDQLPEINKYQNKQQLPFPIVYDEKIEFAGRFRIYGTPTLLLFDKRGRLNKKFFGEVATNKLQENIIELLNK